MVEEQELGRPHITFTWRGKRFVWCHIRKNGSSALLRFIGELLKKSYQPVDIYNLPKKPRHLPHVRSVQDLRDGDRLVLVHRDPLQRFYSAFCDKIIAQRGAEHLLANVGEKIADIETATLESFIVGYLADAPNEVDPHFLPQASHMFNVCYRDEISIDDLYFWVEENFGAGLARKYFLARTNALEEKRFPLEQASRRPVAELRARYRETRAFPRSEDLLSPEIVARLHTVYACDARFLVSH
ncbi:sulfotransferase family 2 domain-containing protein [Roseibium sediminicola]|uniref:Sulfotransferase family protein n=1 Tax=Roseibium sediminicola TaxID=2933272 RepID=A0ABT0H2Z0_9HYPH|nr:sulfotransferase family 2 domain-containing protein [Roseibium sp. CAU 1639]MCK7616052.1 sulfotransferase family protein [Roseibium sp. CAU 1639]